MKLVDVKKEDNYLYAEWRLTFRVGWTSICKAAALIWEYTEEPELYTGSASGETRASVNEAKEILDLNEAGSLTIRGMSKILKVPVMLTFFNQLDLVRMTVIAITKEFEKADYKAFNLSMCQFMDSIELAMYR